ncbi:MAG: type II toxin-antitoxin system HipA family toxin [Bacteroidetes bacterium SB0662_bin_6]|nr:type II toxin-antitoxin system HipA family toxin [Bacteroidetes bacterium SB0668_bin_1]MYE05548.1 type II toxin-antitoxin system HipA family toxin [Bacteroidetes bacterium SB0662_bin_6]
MTHAEVRLWGSTVGAVTLEDGKEVADFEFAPTFLESGIQLAPLTMPLSERVYGFPLLRRESFYGLPGMLADSLPDRFGHAVINAWLAGQGRPPDSLNAVERLCYTGSRGMGALEFVPATGPRSNQGQRLQVDRLVALASEILQQREALRLSYDAQDDAAPLQEILRVGTSAGGARAKAVIAWNPQTKEVRSGQADVGAGFEHWLIKFDGVGGEHDGTWAAPEGYGAIEYAYYLMARDADIEMADCRLFEEGGRRHFMTRRFDRLPDGAKLHMQSLGAMAHFDFNEAGAYSYEQALMVIWELGLSMSAIEEQFRRMAFNVFARNQDDHVKNIAFLMDRAGAWALAPAFDLTYACNPEGKWTSIHQMTLNGKQEAFTMEDFRACARAASMKRGRAEAICAEVHEVVSHWPDYAEEARVEALQRDAIQKRIEEAAIL